jgi:LysR family glycine cleavage system transcriptional activator
MLLVYKPGLLDPELPLGPQLLANNLIVDICPDAERAWQVILEKHQVNNEQVPHFLEIDNAALVVQAVLAGQGIGMVRRRLIEQQLSLAQLQIWPDFELQCDYQYFLVGPQKHFSWPKVQVFKSWLERQFEQPYQ